MRSSYHNLPEINGVEQAPGRSFHATTPKASIGDDVAEYSVDLAPAYPSEAGIDRWIRTSRLERGRDDESTGRIVVSDEWSLQGASNRLVWSLMTADPVEASEPGVLSWPERGVLAEYDPNQVTVTVEDIPVDDFRLTPVWGEHVWRIRLSLDAAAADGTFTMVVRAAT
jgi:hypothetical protein